MIRRLFVLSVLVFSTGCTLKSKLETPTTAYDYSGYDVYGRPVDADRQAYGDQVGWDADAGQRHPPRSDGGFAGYSEPQAASLD